MVVAIYTKKNTNFKNIGLGALSPTLCTITEELNGIFELELTHPYDNTNKYKLIEIERIISVETPRGRQLFRIYKVSPNLQEIKVNARHIFYDLLDNFIPSYSGTNNALNSLNGLVNNFAYKTKFTFTTDLLNNGKIAIENENPISALLGTDEEKPKFIQAYGGELLRDNFNISILNNIGEDRGFTVRYGKNLIGLDIEEDLSSVVTKLYAYGENNILQVVESPRINDYFQAKIGTQTFNANDSTELINQAKSYLETVDIPKVNINVNFVLLANTEEYKKYQILEQVFLGDIVTIYNEKLKFSKKAKVIAYKYNVLANKYDNLTLGDFKSILTTSITKADNIVRTVDNINVNVNNATDTANQTAQKLQGKTQIIDGILYVLDNQNINTAKTIYKFDNKGISKSTTGINGSFNNILQ